MNIGFMRGLCLNFQFFSLHTVDNSKILLKKTIFYEERNLKGVGFNFTHCLSFRILH